MEVNEAIEIIKGTQPFSFGRGKFADAIETLVAFAEWKMRDANIEEIKNTNNYLKSISKPIGIFFEVESPNEKLKMSEVECKNCKYADWYPDNELIYCLNHSCVMAFDGFCSQFVSEVE